MVLGVGKNLKSDIYVKIFIPEHMTYIPIFLYLTAKKKIGASNLQINGFTSISTWICYISIYTTNMILSKLCDFTALITTLADSTCSSTLQDTQVPLDFQALYSCKHVAQNVFLLALHQQTHLLT